MHASRVIYIFHWQLTNTHKAKLTDSECPIVPTFAAFSISDHSESNLDSQSSCDLAPVSELEKPENESIPSLNVCYHFCVRSLTGLTLTNIRIKADLI